MKWNDPLFLLMTYYAVGLLWLLSGLLPKPFGWLHVAGDPPAIALGIMLRAAIWPYLAAKHFWNLINGNNTTDF
jgi:hypothetical protein